MRGRGPGCAPSPGSDRLAPRERELHGVGRRLPLGRLERLARDGGVRLHTGRAPVVNAASLERAAASALVSSASVCASASSPVTWPSPETSARCCTGCAARVAMPRRCCAGASSCTPAAAADMAASSVAAPHARVDAQWGCRTHRRPSPIGGERGRQGQSRRGPDRPLHTALDGFERTGRATQRIERGAPCRDGGELRRQHFTAIGGARCEAPLAAGGEPHRRGLRRARLRERLVAALVASLSAVDFRQRLRLRDLKLRRRLAARRERLLDLRALAVQDRHGQAQRRA